MKTLKMIFALAFTFVASQTVLAASTANHAKEEAAAVKAAEKWLSVVDAGKYAESWKEAADYFRKSVPQTQWETMLGQNRTPLGGVVGKRKVLGKQYLENVPGAPAGKYVTIQFQTTFKNKKDVVETVTPMLEKSGWHVSGYYIK